LLVSGLVEIGLFLLSSNGLLTYFLSLIIDAGANNPWVRPLDFDVVSKSPLFGLGFENNDFYDDSGCWLIIDVYGFGSVFVKNEPVKDGSVGSFFVKSEDVPLVGSKAPNNGFEVEVGIFGLVNSEPAPDGLGLLNKLGVSFGLFELGNIIFNYFLLKFPYILYI